MSEIRSKLRTKENNINFNLANEKIFEYIEIFCNRQRMHSANGNLFPVEFEEKMILEVVPIPII